MLPDYYPKISCHTSALLLYDRSPTFSYTASDFPTYCITFRFHTVTYIKCKLVKNQNTNRKVLSILIVHLNETKSTTPATSAMTNFFFVEKFSVLGIFKPVLKGTNSM